ncbi:MAG: hypothetical protein Q7V01_01570 [Vicinamibacterales bacterium]|nr:hypothetical protein [Vicinamibacterales bacterium]
MPMIPLSTVVPAPGSPSARRGEPVTFGLPFPRGAVTSLDRCAWIAADGTPRLVQTAVRERWADGSVRWGLFHGQVTASGPGAAGHLAVDAGPVDSAARVTVVREGDRVVVDTGAARLTCGVGRGFPFTRVLDVSGTEVIDGSATGLRVLDGDGRLCDIDIDRIAIEEEGPLRAVVRWRGRVTRGAATPWLELDVRAQFFAGLPTVRLALTIRNPAPARHPGNYWELGDPASALIREVALVVTLAGHEPAAVRCSVEAGAPMADCATPFEVYQESSGGPHWDSPVHVNRHGRVVMRLAGYRLKTGSGTTEGLRAQPVVLADTGESRLAVAVPGFWQNFPRAIEVDGRTVRVGLWPGQFPDEHELQGGEQKTHDVVLAFGADDVTTTPLDWAREPLRVQADPEWYCASGAVAHLVPESAEASRDYGGLVRAAIDGPERFALKRERIDEYGWRNYGELYADHEAVLAPPGQPLVSHYNNQYDAIAGFAVQFFRTGDPQWWALMAELADHVVDIDLYHAMGDKAAYSGGPFWHTCHYVDAGRSTHRGYPRVAGVPGGGPGNEHTYSGGLLLHHFLTGDARSRDAVIQLADWVLRIDDGRLSPFRFLDRGDTGLASATRDPWYHGPGRGAAHAIATLLDGYRLTRHDRYLAKAEQLIRRCIHPADDIGARELLDAERRWSYTVFLQVLGRYLRESAERNSRGTTYAWARESLLAYARWMVEHERPYLDAPEGLEYPTETWAAQDMRKCDVLLQASLHAADDHERARFRARAAFFFEASVRTLSRMPTRTLVRPVVILATNGTSFAWFAGRPDASEPGPAGESGAIGDAVPFVPQRVRAIARARWVMGAAVVLSAVAGFLLW